MILTLETLHRYTRTFPGSPCMLWTQGTTSTGYPQARIESKSQLVQRYVFTELLGGAIPRKSRIRPMCGEKLCVSPKCLAAVRCSQIVRDSWRDARRKGDVVYLSRQVRAVRNGWARLTAAQVEAMRARRGEPERRLAAEFGVSRRTVGRVLRGETWRNTYVPPSSVFTLAAA